MDPRERDRYFRAFYWRCVVNGEVVMIELPRPEGNFREDEGMVRYLLRKKLGLTRLPRGTAVVPEKSKVR